MKKENLVHGAYYFGKCRNAQIARWDAKAEVFNYWRIKFGNTFLEEIRCPEDEARYDVFIAERILNTDEITKEIPIAP